MMLLTWPHIQKHITQNKACNVQRAAIQWPYTKETNQTRIIIMRKIESEMLAAITSKSSFSKDNTQVSYFPKIDLPNHSRIETSKVYLHGNHIATVVHPTFFADGRTVVNKDTLADYPTRTTCSRLRALCVAASLKKVYRISTINW